MCKDEIKLRLRRGEKKKQFCGEVRKRRRRRRKVLWLLFGHCVYQAPHGERQLPL